MLFLIGQEMPSIIDRDPWWLCIVDLIGQNLRIFYRPSLAGCVGIVIGQDIPSNNIDRDPWWLCVVDLIGQDFRVLPTAALAGYRQRPLLATDRDPCWMRTY